MKLAAYFFGRNHSFAFTLVFVFIITALAERHYWLAVGLFFIAIPCVAVGEVLYAHRQSRIDCTIIAANDKKIAENAAMIARQMEQMRKYQP